VVAIRIKILGDVDITTSSNDPSVPVAFSVEGVIVVVELTDVDKFKCFMIAFLVSARGKVVFLCLFLGVAADVRVVSTVYTLSISLVFTLVMFAVVGSKVRVRQSSEILKGTESLRQL
jgi:hypothetical protein